MAISSPVCRLPGGDGAEGRCNDVCGQIDYAGGALAVVLMFMAFLWLYNFQARLSVVRHFVN